tara:strand:+ start:4135 stop:4302 length:168 start_codon:yes stop_codon:yes gene_type:complete
MKLNIKVDNTGAMWFATTNINGGVYMGYSTTRFEAVKFLFEVVGAKIKGEQNEAL